MCGIAGFSDLRKNVPANTSLLRTMTDTIRHRGPDSSGYFADASTALGAYRLSIVDPESGDQPLFNEDGSLVLVCNGEIFNHKSLRKELEEKGHRFASGTD